jgi:hypothetical protein
LYVNIVLSAPTNAQMIASAPLSSPMATLSLLRQTLQRLCIPNSDVFAEGFRAESVTVFVSDAFSLDDSVPPENGYHIPEVARLHVGELLQLPQRRSMRAYRGHHGEEIALRASVVG